MAGSQFVAELLAALPPEAQRAALRVVRRWGGRSVYLPVPDAAERQRRREVAALLLRSGVDRAEVARIVAERFGVSASQARRILRNVRVSTATVTPSSRR